LIAKTFLLSDTTDVEPFQRIDVSMQPLAILSVTLSPNSEGFSTGFPRARLKYKNDQKNGTQLFFGFK
jgi:hypothetical protein